MTRATVYEREGAEMVLPRRLVRSSDRALRQQIIHVCQCGAVHICGDACRFNLGQQPFAFDLEAHHAALRGAEAK